MGCISVQNFATEVNAPIYHIIEQLNNAGISGKKPESYINKEEKEKLYNFMLKNHGLEKVQQVQKKKTKKSKNIDAVVIDGTNLLFDHNCCHINKVLVLAEYLKKTGINFIFYFDASTKRHLMKVSDGAAQIYNILINRLEDYFQEVPSGIEADKIILQVAKTDNAHVLSNDNYTDFLKIHTWLSGSDRLIKHHSNKKRVTIPDMDTDLKISKNDWELYKQLLITFGISKPKGGTDGTV